MPTGFDQAFRRVKELVADFRANEKFYLSPAYQEQEARHDFIDKFWLALGWDVNHETQKNPFEQEVKVERKEHGFSQRRADYAFYLAPNFRDVKFYVEAKKPHGDIATADNYFQTARYGWSSSTPVAVLHDFEQFEILDCRYRPHIETALGQNLRKYHFSQYEDSEKFAEIYWLFSREAVAAGSLEKFAATLPKKRGRGVQRGLLGTALQTIDDAFLEELDQFRDELARAFKNANPKLDGDTLTELTQRTLDRLVFLRFLEDKHIEPQNRIAYFGDKGTAWQDFIAESRRLDGIYNGIVYKKHEILDAPGFKLDDEAFSGVCERLSHLNSPYDFNAIPIHILGSIYERFLGKVIVTTDKRARLEEKPEVRKAGGVYYTPEYIVRYIVENTVGKLIAGKSPGQIAEMRFADIACGSGSFLLGVYDLLIRHHTKFYNENPGKAKKGDVVERDDGLHLSLQKKREILLASIYGVDIDPQAVEVAQLSLYLKLLQDETPGSARNYQLEFHETLLPTLNKNIVCGNSLIGTDILTGQLFASDEEKKLNPMDFEQRFPHIFKPGASALRETAAPLDFGFPGVPLHGKFSYKKKKMPKAAPSAVPEFEGGFDAIVGNPPWISLSGKFGNEFLPPIAQEYLIARHGGNTYMPNMYEYFVARGLELVKPGGFFGYIVPDRLGFNSQFVPLRNRIVTTARIQSLQYKVPFPGITADTLVFVFVKGPASASHKVEISEYGHPPLFKPQSELVAQPEHRFEYKIDTEQDALAQRIEAAPNVKPLSEVASCTSGFGGKSQLITEAHVNKAQIKTLKGDSIGRYEHRKGYWFEFKRENITGRTTDREKLGATPKILLRKTGNSIIATFDDSGIYPEQSLYFLFGGKTPMVFKYLLGIINSKLLNWFFKKSCLTNEKSIAQVKTVDLVKLPIRIIDFSQPVDKARHDRMVELVEQMLAARKQLAGAQSDKDKDFYTNRCDGLDRQIDALVYDLYALTPAEIKIVEGAYPK